MYTIPGGGKKKNSPARGYCAGGAGSGFVLKSSGTARTTRRSERRFPAPARPSGRARRSTRHASPGTMSRRRASSSPASETAAGRQPRERLLLTNRPDPARDALAAGLVAEEPRDRRNRPTMSGVSSNTMTTPEPRVASPARVASNVRGASSGPDRRTYPPRPRGEPPGSPRPRDPARQVERLPHRRPERDLVDAGSPTWPQRQNSLGPVDPSVPVAGRTPPPSSIIAARWQRLDVVDDRRLAEQPDLTGNGGLFRGSPRLPSMDSNSAVSSPQMYAPAPRAARCRMRSRCHKCSAREARLRASPISGQARRVFGIHPDVKETFLPGCKPA